MNMHGFLLIDESFLDTLNLFHYNSKLNVLRVKAAKPVRVEGANLAS